MFASMLVTVALLGSWMLLFFIVPSPPGPIDVASCGLGDVYRRRRHYLSVRTSSKSGWRMRSSMM